MTTIARPSRRIPEWLLVDEMDRARRRADDAMRTHDRWAEELGYERVGCHTVQVGDVIQTNTRHGWAQVASIHRGTPDGTTGMFEFRCLTDDGECYVVYEDNEMLSRRLPETDEPF